MPARNIGDLDMSDVRQAACHSTNKIPLGHLGEVDVLLQFDPRIIDLHNDAQCLRSMMLGESWRIRFV